MVRQYTTAPPIARGYPLETGRSWFGVVVPLARTNMLTNGSFETNTTSWATWVSGSIARSTTQQYHGAYSMEVTPTGSTSAGARTSVALTNGVAYAGSCKFKGHAGVRYRIAFFDALSAQLVAYEFVATGRWQWVWVFWKETSGATRFLVISKVNSADTHVFYIDGAQVESLADGVLAPTTYIDGDQVGLVPNQYPPAYLWTGTPHASTAQRSGQTRAGGYVMPLSRYGFLLLAVIGLGMISPTHIAAPFAQLDGAEFQRSLKGPRIASLVGRIDARAPAQLDRYRAALAKVLDRDLVAPQQPFQLLYQRWDREQPVSDHGRVYGHYMSGLGEAQDNLHTDAVSLTFQMFAPFAFADKEEGAALTVQQSVSDANAIAMRSPGGLWSALSTGMSGGAASVYAIVRGLDGTIYAGGDFTNAGGSGADYLAKWNGSSWSVVKSATALNGVVFALAVGPDGRIYVGGQFTNADGIANADRIAVYDPVADTYAALSTGLDGDCNALAFAPGGTLYAVGAFLNAGGGAARRVASWNGSAWAALSTGLDPAGAGVGLTVIVAPDGNVYAGGGFTVAGAATVNYIAKWNGSAWSALGGGMDNVVRTIAVLPNGLIVAGGDFTTAGGNSANRIAVWNGSSWAPLGSGLNNNVSKIAPFPDGRLLVGGTFTTAGGITLPESFAQWNGSAWTYPDIDLPSTPNVYTIFIAPDGTVYAGFTTTGTATSAALTTVTNGGSAKAYPTLTVKGPSSGTSRIYQIVNYTTGKAIYLNLTLSAGETAVLRFDPKALSFMSDFQGNIAAKILPGSNEADFFLQPGANSISFFAAGSTVTGVLSWRPAFDTLGALTF